ncbi:BON domain-containing protein [Marinobacter sp.]|uniref:BON domain-containing protein n=1 Tax=Marinobacter sp. TaxID=50741 RepID=UPI0035645656
MMKADRRYLILAACLLAGCATTDSGQFSESSSQDTSAEVRLKSVLLEDDDIAGSAIDVTIDGERIVLEGFVEDDSQRQRAEQLVREHGDVSDVDNRIEVK